MNNSCIFLYKRNLFSLFFFLFLIEKKFEAKGTSCVKNCIKREFFNVVLMLMIIFNNIFIKFLSRRKYI